MRHHQTMNSPTALARIAALLLPLSLASLAPELAAQEAAQRKSGTIFKREVDGLVRSIRGELLDNGSVGGTVADTARLLTAMGYCHRLYHAGDGPVVRPQLEWLFSHRRADGSFGTPEESVLTATAWARSAMQVLNPKGYASDITLLNRWLKGKGQTQDPFGELVDGVLAEAAKGVWPEQVGAQALQKDPAHHPLDLLVQLVACQVANKRLDAGTGPSAAAWSKAQQAGVDYLMGLQEGGVFSVPTPAGSFPDPGITSLALAAIATKPGGKRSEAEQQTLMQGWAWILDQQNPDGSFGRQTINYTTCAAVQALKRWDDPKAKQALAEAQRYILGIQNIESRGYTTSDRDYGSIGYGGDERGDLSNTVFALDALRSSGLEGYH
mgnify:CR=1 FL=1